MDNTHQLHHIKATTESLNHLNWARKKAIEEYQRGIMKKKIKSHSEEIIWMYEKIQQLSKALKNKLEMENDKQDE